METVSMEWLKLDDIMRRIRWKETFPESRYKDRHVFIVFAYLGVSMATVRPFL